MSRRPAPASPAEAVARLAAEHWPRFWVGCDAEAAAADVLARLQAATSEWRLSDVRAMRCGVHGLVCSATWSGMAVVVKLTPRFAGIDHPTGEGDALALWSSTGGAVALFDRRDGGYTLLLERLVPGDRLEDAGMRPEEMLGVCGTIARRLHEAGPAARSFGRLVDTDSARTWLELLADEPGLQDELRGLLAQRDDEVLVHGDLHTGNILRHGDGWKVIDPQPVRADRHTEIQPLYEASLWFGPDGAGDRDLAERWLQTYAAAAGMDPHRARRFTMLRALAAARRIASHPNPGPRQLLLGAGLHRLADALR